VFPIATLLADSAVGTRVISFRMVIASAVPVDWYHGGWGIFFFKALIFLPARLLGERRS